MPYLMDVLSPKVQLQTATLSGSPRTENDDWSTKKRLMRMMEGWNLEERIARATAILKGSGFSDNFAPYVFTFRSRF